jgi:hypothetical protein
MDAVEKLLAAAERQRDKAEAEYQKALRLQAEQKIEAMQREIERLAGVIQHADIVRGNTLGLLREMKPRNGTEADDIRRHKEILAQSFIPLMQRSA